MVSQCDSASSFEENRKSEPSSFSSTRIIVETIIILHIYAQFIFPARAAEIEATPGRRQKVPPSRSEKTGRAIAACRPSAGPARTDNCADFPARRGRSRRRQRPCVQPFL